MTKELQNLAWSVLPKEFKEEVKKMYKAAQSYILGDIEINARVCESVLLDLFGEPHLTSDAEDEEILTISRKRVQEMYAATQLEGMQQAEDVERADHYAEALRALFGEKCLPDENSSNLSKLEKNDESKPAEPKKSRCEQCGAPNSSICAHMNCQDYMPQTEPKPAEPKYHVGQKVKFKDKDFGFEITAIEKWDDCDEYKYKLAGWKRSYRESELEPYNGTNFHEGDKVIINAPKSDLHGKVGIVKYLDHVDDGMIGVIYDSEKCAYVPNDCLEPYTEPKFKVGDTASYVYSPTLKHKCTVTKVMQNKHSDKWEYNVMYEWGKPGMWIPESDLEPYTELDKESRNLSQDNKSVDNDLKDTHQNESLFGKKLDCTMTGRLLGVENLRLKIAAMAMQGILSNGDWGDYRGGNDQEVRIAKASFGFADALIAESKLSMQPLSCTNDSDNGID